VTGDERGPKTVHLNTGDNPGNDQQSPFADFAWPLWMAISQKYLIPNVHHLTAEKVSASKCEHL
jgi:hypothetical protein